MTVKRTLTNHTMDTRWTKADNSGHSSGVTVTQKKSAKDNWYHNSWAAEGHSTTKWSASGGADTSDLFKPTPGKPNFLTNLLGKLPAWQKKGEFATGTAVSVKEGQFKNGIANGQYRASVLEASVSGQGKVAFKDGALSATGNLHAQATLVDAEGSIHIGKGGYGVDASASAYVGAKADLKGEVVIDPKNGIYAARVGGEAFAGARAGVEGNAHLGSFGSVGGRAEAWAGVGAAFHAEAGFKNGRFKARFDVGAALGIGFKLGFNVDINVKGITDAIKKPFQAIGSAVSKGVETVKNAVSSVGHAVSSAAKSVAHFFGF